MMHRFWADYTARDFALLDRENVIAVLPVGATEQHGPHLPLSVDHAILDGIIVATAPLIPDRIPAVFLPTIPVGKSNEHSAWPGTLTFSARTFIAVLMDLGDSIAASGVRKLVILNSHGGQIAPMDIVVRDLRIKHRMLAVAASWFALGMPEGLLSAEEQQFGIHAGDMETSMMLALHDSLVQMEHARNFRTAIASVGQHLGFSPSGKLGWMAQDLNAAGACGDASAATAEKGQALIEHASRQVVRLLDEVNGLPLSFLDNVVDQDVC